MTAASTGQRSRWSIGVEFKREDCWLGVFWRTRHVLDFHGGWPEHADETTWWVCLLPMVPVVVTRIKPESYNPPTTMPFDDEVVQSFPHVNDGDWCGEYAEEVPS